MTILYGMVTMNKKEMLSVKEAAQVLGLSAIRVRQLCKSQNLGKIVGNSYVILRSDLEHFAARDRKPGRPRKKF